RGGLSNNSLTEGRLLSMRDIAVPRCCVIPKTLFHAVPMRTKSGKRWLLGRCWPDCASRRRECGLSIRLVVESTYHQEHAVPDRQPRTAPPRSSDDSAADCGSREGCGRCQSFARRRAEACHW